MNISIWYHCKISGEGVPDPNFGMNLVVEQSHALKESGLSQAAQEIHIGVNGGLGDTLAIAQVAEDSPKVQTHIHGPAARTEIPTLKLLRDWLPDHPNWAVLYHHTKGVSHGDNPLFNAWRRRLEGACVWGWRTCLRDLEAGADAVGAHWLTPEEFPGMVSSPFFGGTFWWANSNYLSQLPPLPPPTVENRYEAEAWIGRRRPYPRIVNYIPGWP